MAILWLAVFKIRLSLETLLNITKKNHHDSVLVFQKDSCENVAGVSDQTHAHTCSVVYNRLALISGSVQLSGSVWNIAGMCARIISAPFSSAMALFCLLRVPVWHKACVSRKGPASLSQIKLWSLKRRFVLEPYPSPLDQLVQQGAYAVVLLRSTAQGLVTHGAHTPHLQPLHHTPAKTWLF